LSIFQGEEKSVKKEAEEHVATQVLQELIKLQVVDSKIQEEREEENISTDSNQQAVKKMRLINSKESIPSTEKTNIRVEVNSNEIRLITAKTQLHRIFQRYGVGLVFSKCFNNIKVSGGFRTTFHTSDIIQKALKKELPSTVMGAFRFTTKDAQEDAAKKILDLLASQE